jgi:selenide,water dikinase
MLGFDTSDDCAVLRMNDDQAIVLTLDFFTPVTDDPYEFGAVAASNSISDVYAMGATPVAALNVMSFPRDLGTDVSDEILRGGADKIAESGAILIGGHIVEDCEPKYGLAVLGIAHPDKVKRNEGARVGDVLVYTKPIGMGLMHSAFLAGLETPESMRSVIDFMMELNKSAAEAMQGLDAHAVTDVTGFGLAGHLHEMLESSGTSALLRWDSIPLFDRAYQYSCDGCRPGKTFDTVEWASEFVKKGRMDDITYDDRMGVLCDPQTSGGLLISLSPKDADAYLKNFKQLAGREAAVIAEVVDGPGGYIFVR